jgi:L-fucose mutarotase/ribose pyranase (RbsD/FucU family)
VPDPVVMMAVVDGDRADPRVHDRYCAVIEAHQPRTPPIQFLPRQAFYDRARQAFAVVATGDTATYANLLLKKGRDPGVRSGVRGTCRSRKNGLPLPGPRHGRGALPVLT